MNLNDLLKLCEAATPGPYRALNGSGMAGVHGPDCKIYHAPFEPEASKQTHDRQKADADYFAALNPSLVRALVKVAMAADRYMTAMNSLEDDLSDDTKEAGTQFSARIMAFNSSRAPLEAALTELNKEFGGV
jgi:hypothetical protein